MPHRLRKFIGMVMLVALVILWALVAMGIAQGRIQEAWKGWQMLYYVVAGIGWVFPAMWIIRWMEKPPAGENA